MDICCFVWVFLVFVLILLLLACESMGTAILSPAVISIKISNLLICFCSYKLSCTILEKYNFIENMYIVLYCLIK